MYKVDFQKPLLIQSLAFKAVFLRVDGSGINKGNGSGAGKVNCQKNLAQTGALLAHKQDDGTFTLESVRYPGVFLRMDGNGVRSFAGSGAGTVNCQFGAGQWERFQLNKQGDGSYTIESAAFPNVFLRMDGNNPSGKEGDFGTVNCQYGAGAYEAFNFMNFPEIGTMKDLLGNFPL